MESHILLQLVLIISLGTVGQWLAWRLKLPSILLLLTLGITFGPVLGIIKPQETFSFMLMPLVGIFIAIILFEGSLNLKFRELKRLGLTLFKMLSIGVVISWALNTVAGVYILKLSFPISLLMGAILVVTGPTVIMPLLRRIKASRRVSSLVKWEGIVNDPVGAILAVLVLEVLISQNAISSAYQVFVTGIVETLAIGLGLGIGSGILLTWLLKKYYIPDYLQNPAAIMFTLGIFAMSNEMQPDSGLLSVTVLGIFMANQRSTSIQQIIEFKENLQVLLISSLFIMLSARLEMRHLTEMGSQEVLFLAFLIFISRPIAIFLSTMGKDLNIKERVFLAFLAPRGIIAAAVTSVFALELSHHGFPEAERMVPIMFFVIIGTVIFYDLLSPRLAFTFGLANPQPQGILILGCHPWARSLAVLLQEEEIEILMVDSNQVNVNNARLDGLHAAFGSILSEVMVEELELNGIGYFMALTRNNDVNTLGTLHVKHTFGSPNVFQLVPETWSKDLTKNKEKHSRLQGRLLFDETSTYKKICDTWEGGGEFKKTKLTDQFTFDQFVEHHGPEVIPLLTKDSEGNVQIFTADQTQFPSTGVTLFFLLP